MRTSLSAKSRWETKKANPPHAHLGNDCHLGAICWSIYVMPTFPTEEVCLIWIIFRRFFVHATFRYFLVLTISRHFIVQGFSSVFRLAWCCNAVSAGTDVCNVLCSITWMLRILAALKIAAAYRRTSVKKVTYLSVMQPDLLYTAQQLWLHCASQS